jgi:ribose 5-phosphate isomerase
LLHRLFERLEHLSASAGVLLQQVSLVASSSEVDQLALQLISQASPAVAQAVSLSQLARHTLLDVAIDGCDAFDDALNALKGGGGGEGGAAMAREKLNAVHARRFVLIAEQKKQRKVLAEREMIVPIEVLPVSVHHVLSFVRGLSVYGAVPSRCTVRSGVRKAGPVISDNGNYVIDAVFAAGAQDDNVTALSDVLKRCVGVVEHGLFVHTARAHTVFVAQEDGALMRLDCDREHDSEVIAATRSGDASQMSAVRSKL